MKRVCVIILALIMLLCACGSSPIADLSETKDIRIIVDGETLIQVGGTAPEYFCENLMSLGLKKMKNTEPMPELCTLEFLDSNGKILECLSVSQSGWISCKGKSYAVAAGELDMVWINTHISIAENHRPK